VSTPENTPTPIGGEDGTSTPYGMATEATLADVKTATETTAEAVAPRSTAPVNYNVTATTTPTALASAVCTRVLLVAGIANTGYVRVGGTSTSTTVGVPLGPGGSREYVVDNANLITHCAVTGSQTLHVEVIP
jgi:hypothetical protein